MIVYYDSSALVKLYIEEVASDATKDLQQQASVLATCRISWVEVFASFARRSREQPQDEAAITEAGHVFRADWPAFMRIEVSQTLVEQAGLLAEAFALRAYDSIQLASARLIMDQTGNTVSFACFDKRLNQAATLLGMQVPFAQAPL